MDSDPELEIEKDKDSGMSSMGESKDETPERRTGEVSCWQVTHDDGDDIPVHDTIDNFPMSNLTAADFQVFI